MISKLIAENYGCLNRVEVPLTPLHAFIGPNDSGKSTLLRAIRTLMQFAGGSFALREDKVVPFDPMFSSEASNPTIVHGDTPHGWYEVRTLPTPGRSFLELRVKERAALAGAEAAQQASRAFNDATSFRGAQNAALSPIVTDLALARLFRFDPDALRAPSSLIPESAGVGFLDERGAGLPGVYQAVLSRGDEAFWSIRDAVRTLFPTVKKLGVPALTRDTLVLEIELTDGTRVRGEQLSEGLLYYLAFAIIPFLEPCAAILVEEPENGLHPARIAEVIRTLRRVSENGPQVIIATHSPLVVNELRPEEVTVVTRPSLEEGTRPIPIRETPHFGERSSVYALGELWLSYANGRDEAPLLQGKPRAKAG